jgi:hypothetical protein
VEYKFTLIIGLLLHLFILFFILMPFCSITTLFFSNNCVIFYGRWAACLTRPSRKGEGFYDPEAIGCGDEKNHGEVEAARSPTGMRGQSMACSVVEAWLACFPQPFLKLWIGLCTDVWGTARKRS